MREHIKSELFGMCNLAMAMQDETIEEEKQHFYDYDAVPKLFRWGMAFVFRSIIDPSFRKTILEKLKMPFDPEDISHRK